MDYFKLILGLILTPVFIWILIRRSKRIGFLHSIMSVDTVMGIVAGMYLTVMSIRALWVG